MNTSEWRLHHIPALKKISDTAMLDADLMLSYVLKKPRAALLAKMQTLEPFQEKQLNNFIQRRLKGEPMAYLIHHQPFWTLDLQVTKDTLIPRPETECLIEWILKQFDKNDVLTVADLGTGSGAIALALAKEKPRWKITATDISEEALSVAKQNAEKNNLNNIVFSAGNWCAALPHHDYDIIISNPPYIAEDDPHLSHLLFEPALALLAGKEGLSAIQHLVPEAKNYLKQNGVLIIEHGFDQSESVGNIFKQENYKNITMHRDLSDLPRFVVGKK